MQIGYARSSTVDQGAGFEAQKRALKAANCEKVFAEQVSSVAQRAQLEAAIEYAREGDSLVITRLDRLARSVSQLVAIGERISVFEPLTPRSFKFVLIACMRGHATKHRVVGVTLLRAAIEGLSIGGHQGCIEQQADY